jgi:multidrug efflux pump subunit AcrB
VGGSGLIATFARHRTLANLLMAVMLVAGLHAATRIRAQFFPDVVSSEVSVTVAWPGAGAADVDRAVVELLDPVLAAIDGVSATSAVASDGQARIDVEFDPGHDIDRAVDAVELALDSVSDLPQDAEAPEVRRSLWRDQVTDVVISGPVGLDQLGRIADDLAARLFARGVTRTTIRGFAAPVTVVEVPRAALVRHDLTLAEIAAAVAGGTGAAPAGEMGDGARVRTGAEARSPAAIAAIPLRAAPDGSALTLGDVATIRVEPANRGRAAYVGADPAVTMRIDRGAAGDALETQAEVEAVLAALRPDLPAGVTLDLVRARAELIAARLNLLLDNALLGLGIVLVLLGLFLNARTALWVAAGIPVALAAALCVMWLAGLSLNMISLFALILTLGMVVDDAVVVGEHADWRARHLGETPEVAAEAAARAMWTPVLASMLTTVAAFAGLMAMGGRFGEMIADIPFTVIAVLAASFVECFLILPNHMRHALRAQVRPGLIDLPSRLVNRGFGWLRDRLVRPFARAVIAARYPVLAAAVFLLATQVALFLRGEVRFRFFDAPEQSSVSANFSMLPGASRTDAEAMMRELQRATAAVAGRYAAEHGTNPVTFLLAEVGGPVGRGFASADGKDPDLLGGISIELIEPDARPYSSFAFLADVEAEVRPHPRLEELSFRGGRFGPGGDALAVDLSGADTATLKAASEAVKAALRGLAGVSAVEDSLPYDKSDLILTLTPRGEALGFTTDGVGRALRDMLSGIEAATYPEGPRTAAIRVELPEAERTADFLERAMLRAAPGSHVPLADIVTVEERAGFSTIRRQNGQRVVSITADVAADDPALANAVTQAVAAEILPRIEARFGVTARLSGQAEEEARFLAESLVGLWLALLAIYLILAWVFASWTRPLVVMAVIPFGLIGAIWGHWLWDVPMSMFSIVGLIGMAGIIVNGAIVLVAAAEANAATRPWHAAVVDAVAERLRPVFLTTATTVLGLAPLLYEPSSQAIFLKPTVITLVYGLGFSMVLVLLVTPALLAVEADIARPLTALRRSLARRSPLRRPLGLAVLALAGLFAATFGAVAAYGALPAPLAALAAPLAGGSAPLAAAALFLAGSAAIVLAAAVLAAGRRR